MENDVPEEGTTSQKKSLLTNPTLMGWIAIISFLLGVWGIYLTFGSDRKPKPVYKILSDISITPGSSDSKIKVFYDSIEVENVRAVTISLWNAGNGFLSKDAFSKERPLAISCVKAVSILEFRTLKSTRPGLILTPTLYADSVMGTPQDSLSDESDFVALEIQGDEGLEVQDGVTCQILYTAKASDNFWSVNARIKGVPEGFNMAIESAIIASIILDIIMPLMIVALILWSISAFDRNYLKPNGRTTTPIYLYWIACTMSSPV